uniref:Ig-like domain-containing protein n=1 Tax=Erpetoichthys calabaricus TaxID=27687 RepID=A0A8C4XD03_ERPCA
MYCSVNRPHQHFYVNSLPVCSSCVPAYLPAVSPCWLRFQVVGPSSAVLVFVGQDVTLPASLSPAMSAQWFEVRWFRDDLFSPVLLYQNLQIRSEHQLQTYKGRTSLFLEELLNGNVSLRLQDVRVSDGGLYKCLVASGPYDEEAHITLNVEGDCFLFYITPLEWPQQASGMYRILTLNSLYTALHSHFCFTWHHLQFLPAQD